MELDLQKYFAGQSDSLETQVDLSGLELGGVKPLCAPVKVRVELRGSSDSVQLTARVLYVVSMPCDRCGQETVREFDREFAHLLVRELAGEQDDDAYVVVEDDRLDLDELVREDILLDLPTKYLCREDCKGLCPKCGKNLNEGPCGCDRRETDPRLEALKSLLEK